MTEQHEWGMGVDWAQSSGDKTCVTIVRKDEDGTATIMAVLYGEVAEYLANLFNEYETLKRATEALTAEQARDISNRNLTVSEHEDLQAYADALAG